MALPGRPSTLRVWLRSTQLVPQHRCVDEHSGRQLLGTVESGRGPASKPLEGVHTQPPQVPLHMLPQPPQWLTSICVNTQRPSQQTWVLAHGSGHPPVPPPAQPAAPTKLIQTVKANRLHIIADPSRTCRRIVTRVSLDASAPPRNGSVPCR